MYSKASRTPKNKIREMLLFDYNFRLEYGLELTGKKFGISLRTTSRNLFL
jgi:hypothetical protein